MLKPRLTITCSHCLPDVCQWPMVVSRLEHEVKKSVLVVCTCLVRLFFKLWKIVFFAKEENEASTDHPSDMSSLGSTLAAYGWCQLPTWQEQFKSSPQLLTTTKQLQLVKMLFLQPSTSDAREIYLAIHILFCFYCEMWLLLILCYKKRLSALYTLCRFFCYKNPITVFVMNNFCCSSGS